MDCGGERTNPAPQRGKKEAKVASLDHFATTHEERKTRKQEGVIHSATLCSTHTQVARHSSNTQFPSLRVYGVSYHVTNKKPRIARVSVSCNDNKKYIWIVLQ